MILKLILLIVFILILKISLVINYKTAKKKRKNYFIKYPLKKYDTMNFKNKLHYFFIRRKLKKMFPDFFNLKKPSNLYQIKKYLESKNINFNNYMTGYYNYMPEKIINDFIEKNKLLEY